MILADSFQERGHVEVEDLAVDSPKLSLPLESPQKGFMH